MHFVAKSLILVITIFSSTMKANASDLPDHAYLDGKDSEIGVVLCHGRGKHPTWLVVDPLRKEINRQLGYHTLSIQMPGGNIGWKKYKKLFPEAHKRIAVAVRFLKQEKKVKIVYLMGHSMGSRMATSYLADNPDSGIAGFIGVGVRNGGGEPLDSNTNLRLVDIPVLDVYGDGGNGKDAIHAASRSDLVNQTYQQVLIPDANHKFTEHETEMVNVVVDWLKKQI